jgi:hypothetical protein
MGRRAYGDEYEDEEEEENGDEDDELEEYEEDEYEDRFYSNDKGAVSSIGRIALESESPVERLQAREALTEIGRKGNATAARVLGTIALESESPVERLQAREALTEIGRKGNATAARMLGTIALESESPVERLQAREALAEIAKRAIKQEPLRAQDISHESKHFPGKVIESGRIKEKETIREIVKVRCSYCKQLYEEHNGKCPNCGGK